MSRAVLASGASPGGRAVTRSWRETTPGKLRLQSILVASAAAALLVVGSGVFATVQFTVSNVQQQTVSAIVGVQRLHAWLAAADRSAANSYLSGGAELTLPQQQYEADIAAASQELEQAGEHNPAGSQGTHLLSSISQEVDQYTRLVDTAMVQHRLGNADGLQSLRDASNEMHQPRTGILAEVEQLGDLYSSVLANANLALRVSAGALVVFALVALYVIVQLVRTQRFVRIRFRRRRNSALLAATLAAAVLTAGTGMGAAMAARAIAQSQEQYARLLNLWQARSVAYDANGATSLFLITGSTQGAAFDQAYQSDTTLLVDRPLSDEMMQQATTGEIKFGGLLADEVRQAGSAGERSAALQVIQSYRQFLAVDAQVHQEATAGHAATALNLTLGSYGSQLGLAFKSLDWGPKLGAQRDWSEGELGFAFEQFDWNLAQLAQMLQSEFDDSIAAALRIVEGTLALQALSIGIAALTYAGLRPRIAEYSI